MKKDSFKQHLEFGEECIFEKIFNIQEIQILQDSYSAATGLASIITEPDGTPITKPSNFTYLCEGIIRKNPKGSLDCRYSDSLLEESEDSYTFIKKCSACGLWDAGVKIIIKDHHLANWMIGQVRNESQSVERIREYAELIGVDANEAEEAFLAVPVMSVDTLKRKLDLLLSLSNQISNNALQKYQQSQLIESMKSTELLLSRNEQEIESIFRAAPAGIGVVSNRILTKVNNRFCEMLEYSEEELLGKSARILYSNDQEFNYVGLEKYRQIKQKGTGSVETKFLCKSGKIIDVILSSTPLDLTDLEKGVTFTALDITYLKNKDKELFESEKKYRNMMETMEDPIYICSSDYKIEYTNPAMKKMLGSDPIGGTCFSTIFGFDSICSWCPLNKLKHNEPITFDVTNPMNDHEYHISCSPIKHNTSEISMFSIFRDITEFKRLQLNIQQSQKMESIGTLAGGIAHDFNNILSPIIGYTELARTNLPIDCKEYDYLSEVLKGSERAKDLIQQILSLSRSSDYDMKPIYPYLAVSEALKLIKASLPATIEIKENLDKDDNTILASSTHLHQITMNLCTNAFHSMEQDGGILSVALKKVKLSSESARFLGVDPGHFCCLTVTDTGCGINPKHMNQIFDPYFTTKSKDKGTGLGLAIINGIVKDYSGAIEVESIQGTGTTFRVYFPIVISNSKQTYSTKKEEQTFCGNEKILLVDDEVPIAQMGQKLLEKLGYHVTIKSDSITALKMIEEKTDFFDLVITDLTMPNLSGLEFAKKIHEMNENINIIITSGYKEDEVKLDFKSNCIESFIKKPFSINPLSKEIRRVLDKKT